MKNNERHAKHIWNFQVSYIQRAATSARFHYEPFPLGIEPPGWCCGIRGVQTCAPYETSTLLLKRLFISGATRRVHVHAEKIQVSRVRCFLTRADRSRCHKAVFNRISPSLLDIFCDSRAASHFQDDITIIFLACLVCCYVENQLVGLKTDSYHLFSQHSNFQ